MRPATASACRRWSSTRPWARRSWRRSTTAPRNCFSLATAFIRKSASCNCLTIPGRPKASWCLRKSSLSSATASARAIAWVVRCSRPSFGLHGSSATSSGYGCSTRRRDRARPWCITTMRTMSRSARRRWTSPRRSLTTWPSRCPRASSTTRICSRSRARRIHGSTRISFRRCSTRSRGGRWAKRSPASATKAVRDRKPRARLTPTRWTNVPSSCAAACSPW